MADLLETGEQLLENNLLSGNNSVDVFGDESKEDKELFGGDNDREWLENDEMGHTKVSIRAFLSRSASNNYVTLFRFFSRPARVNGFYMRRLENTLGSGMS